MSNKLNDRLLLEIVVPSYGRAERLEKAIGRLASIIEGLESVKVSVYIQGTNSIKPNSRIKEMVYRFHQRNINFGMNGNIIPSYLESEAEYVWVLSDDDELSKELLLFILDYIMKNQPNIIWIDNDINDYNLNFNTDLTKFLSNLDREGFSKFLLISSWIFKSDLVQAYASRMILYSSAMIPHLVLALSGFEGMGKLSKIDRYRLQCGKSNSSWSVVKVWSNMVVTIALFDFLSARQRRMLSDIISGLNVKEMFVFLFRVCSLKDYVVFDACTSSFIFSRLMFKRVIYFLRLPTFFLFITLLRFKSIKDRLITGSANRI